MEKYKYSGDLTDHYITKIPNTFNKAKRSQKTSYKAEFEAYKLKLKDEKKSTDTREKLMFKVCIKVEGD